MLNEKYVQFKSSPAGGSTRLSSQKFTVFSPPAYQFGNWKLTAVVPGLIIYLKNNILTIYSAVGTFLMGRKDISPSWIKTFIESSACVVVSERYFRLLPLNDM